jgi:dipeptidyl aminopeptidase/acylaminoacyl peptidase
MSKILAALLLLFVIPAYPQTGKFEYLDVFNLEYVSDPEISPDGRRIVYVRNFQDVMTDKSYSNLWIINTDGSGNRPLTTGNQNDFSPQWSPDGSMLLFKSNRDGKSQLYLRWMNDGAETRLTNFTQSPGSFLWGPDGEFILFNMFVPGKTRDFASMPEKPEGAKWNDPPKYIDKLNYRSDGEGYVKEGYMQLFTLSKDGGTPRQLTFEQNDHYGFDWSNDQGEILFTANMHENGELDPANTEIYAMDLETLEVKPLTARQGPDQNPVVSPDGKNIAYLGFDDKLQGYQVTRLYMMNPDGSGNRLLSGEFDRDIRQVEWKDDGKGIYFAYDDLGNTKIGYMTLDGKLSVLAGDVGGTTLGRPYASGSFSTSANGNIAYTYSTPEHPADLMVVNRKNEPIRLTRLNDDLFGHKKSGNVEEIWFESGYDQRKIQGWICKPPGFDPGEKYPLILEIHGGPFANYGNRFSAEMQLYAAAGYVVLYTNPRGSTSYGEAFGNLIHHNYPGQDYDDLMSGVDAMIGKGYIDENRLYVTGGSGGGILTAWIIGKTNRFSAAVVAKPVINWYSFVLYADGPAFFSKYWFGAYPWENPDHYLSRSPISLVGNVETPTMLLTGEEDYRTPIAETEQYYAALKLRQVRTAMVRIPGAGHGIADRPSNLIAKVVHILEWFGSFPE